FQPVNTEDSARVYGLELESGLHLPQQGLELEFGAAFYHSEIRTDEDLPGRERLPGQPEYLLRLGASWQQNEWQHGLLWRLQGDTEQFCATPRAIFSCRHAHRCSSWICTRAGTGSTGKPA